MIKILHLFHEYLPITQNWSYRTLKNLPDCEIYIGAQVINDNEFYDPEFTYFFNPKQGLVKWVGQFKKRIFKYPLGKLLRFYFRKSKPYIKYLEQAIPKENITIIHAHFADLAYHYSSFVKKTDLPFVISFYGLDYEYIPHARPEFIARYKQLFKDAALFVCEGNHGVKLIAEMGCPKEKIIVNRLGVDLGKINFLERQKRKGHLELIQIASYREKKGHRYTLQAFKKALETCPNMKLTLIGGGQGVIKTWIDNYIAEHGLEERVIQIERINFSELYDYLAKYDVFIHPSCYASNRDCEGGAPVVLLDAQATGMPVIATKHCDIPEEVIDQKTGLLSEEKDVAGIATAIKRFYEMDQEEYNWFANNGRQHVENFYDARKNAVALREAYAKL